MDKLQVGRIEQLTSDVNFSRFKPIVANGKQVEQINERLDIIEQHIKLIEEFILEFRHFLPQNENRSSA